jgi:DNA-binding XRE family transcriptional regulator
MLCPCCLKQTEADLIDEPESLTIRDVQVIAEARYYRCRSCGGEWDHPDHDQMEIAYREYRRLKGWLQPEDIRTLRNARGWTQEEMDRHMGWRERTTERYENGNLQTEEHQQGMRSRIAEQ